MSFETSKPSPSDTYPFKDHTYPPQTGDQVFKHETMEGIFLHGHVHFYNSGQEIQVLKHFASECSSTFEGI